MSDDATNLEMMASIFPMDPRNKAAILSASATIRQQAADIDVLREGIMKRELEIGRLKAENKRLTQLSLAAALK